MKIEVALNKSASTKERGDLLESLTEKLLKAQSYEVIKEIRFTAVELDLLCRHKYSGKEIYVECKAYRDKNIDANILKNLAGTLFLKDYSEAWLIGTQGLIILDRFLCITLKNNEIRNSLIDPANVIK